MAFLTPTVPDIDVDEFRSMAPRDRLRISTQHWAEYGFGTPFAIVVVYLLKIVAYVVGGAAIIVLTTPGLGGFGDIGSWWNEPIVLQKAVLWTLLFEVLGLGCGFGPLTLHFMPPLTAPLQWLRVGTTRLPPWPERVPLTRGWTRTPVDVVLYIGVIAATVFALAASGDTDRVVAGDAVGLLDPIVVIPLLVVLPVLGLRDKTIFLAARSEQYLVMTALFLFPYQDLIVGSKWVFVAIWWGAATSKLNRHFPFVVATMIANAPLRPRAFRRALFVDPPNDLRPSKVASTMAHVGTVIEFLVPLAIIVGGGGTLTRVGIVVMVIFHLHIISALPLGVPLEWNVFFIFGTIFLFGAHGDVSMFSGSSQLYVFLVVALVAMPVLGNLRPDLVSFLPAMRYYAGNWATSAWMFDESAEEKFAAGLKTISPPVRDQLATFYDDDTIMFLVEKSYAFRSMHSHGRALNGLIPRAADVMTHRRHEGEVVAGLALGWNFGEGHLHDESLLAAVQSQCHFEPGELRVVCLEAQPMGHPFQTYRIVDAATGELERGVVAVADMIDRQPWPDDEPFPVQVSDR